MASIRSIRKRGLAQMGEVIRIRKWIGPCTHFPNAGAAAAFLSQFMCPEDSDQGRGKETGHAANDSSR